jgi:hypothetical protein
MMIFAYADPPYIGQAHRRYRQHPDYGGEVDHHTLIRSLDTSGYDGWALSASSPSLRQILPWCPEKVRVMAWVKPFCAAKDHTQPAYAWEPVIVSGGRRRIRGQARVSDWIVEYPIQNQRQKYQLIGVKPRAFCYWLFDVLNMQADDEFIDLFPGSGAVTEAWQTYQAHLRGVPIQLPMMLSG